MKRVLLLFFVTFFVTVLAAGSACAQDEGAALFKADCARCHHDNGDGKTVAGAKMKIPDLRSPEIQNLTDEQLFQTIGNGVQHKQYPHTFLSKGMTKAQVRQLVAYIRTLKKK